MKTAKKRNKTEKQRDTNNQNLKKKIDKNTYAFDMCWRHGVAGEYSPWVRNSSGKK